jgi:hypothetical protein
LVGSDRDISSRVVCICCAAAIKGITAHQAVCLG